FNILADLAVRGLIERVNVAGRRGLILLQTCNMGAVQVGEPCTDDTLQTGDGRTAESPIQDKGREEGSSTCSLGVLPGGRSVELVQGSSLLSLGDPSDDRDTPRNFFEQLEERILSLE